MSGTPNIRQIHYRVRTDTGTVDASPTFGANEDTSYTVTFDTAVRVRTGFENTGTGAATCQNVTFTRCGLALPGTNYSTTTAFLQAVDAGSSADATAVTVQRLTSGTGTFLNGIYDEDGSQSLSITNGRFTEYENGLKIISADAGGGETYNIRWRTGVDTVVVNSVLVTPEQTGSDFQPGNQLGGSASTTADQASISMTTAAAATANQLVVVCVGGDNNQSTDGDEGMVTSLTVNGESATKAVEYCNGQGSAQSGTTISIWYVQLAGDAAASSTITANLSNSTSRDNMAIKARAFSVASGKTVAVEATNGSATDGAANPASIDATTSNIECLRVCARSNEGNVASFNTSTIANQPKVTDSNWSWMYVAGNIAHGTGTVSAILAESRISTGTGAASLIRTAQSATDWASAYVAFRADAGGGAAGQPIVKRAGGVEFMHSLGRMSGKGIRIWFEQAKDWIMGYGRSYRSA